MAVKKVKTTDEIEKEMNKLLEDVKQFADIPEEKKEKTKIDELLKRLEEKKGEEIDGI